MTLVIADDTKQLMRDNNVTLDDLLDQFVVDPDEVIYKYVNNFFDIGHRLVMVSICEEEEEILVLQVEALPNDTKTLVYESTAYNKFIVRTGFTSTVH